MIGWSWSPLELADRLRLPADDHRRAALAVENPMSAEHSLLRTTLLGGLLDVAQRNVTRGIADVAIFESGAVFAASGEQLPHEPHLIGALLTGALRQPTWVEPRPPRADFFAAKGVLAHLLDTLRVDWKLEPSSESFLHPGRTARVVVTPHGGGDEVVVGWIGELHPTVAATGIWSGRPPSCSTSTS